MVLRKSVVSVCLACVLPVLLVAQSEDFKGEFKVDKGKVKDVKRIALVDVVGQTKLDRQKVVPWTEAAFAATVEGFRKAGFEVVSGPDVKAAFLEVAPVPSIDDVRTHVRKSRSSRGMSDAQVDAAVKIVYANWEKHEFGEYQKFGLYTHRPPGSVSLERPIFSSQDPTKSKNADEKELRRRIAAMREKLGVDAVVRIDYGFGSWRYEEPAWQKQAKANGAVIGIIPAIQSIKGLLQGSKANAFFNIEMYDREGKKRIVEVNGACKSKEGTGLFSFKPGAVEEFVTPAVEDCARKIFDKYDDKRQ